MKLFHHQTLVAPGSKAGRGLKLLHHPTHLVVPVSSARLQSRARIETEYSISLDIKTWCSARLQSRARIETPAVVPQGTTPVRSARLQSRARIETLHQA